MEKIIFICNRYGVTMDELFKEEVPTPGEPPVEAPLLSARTLGSELSNLYANLSPYNKSIGIMLLTVIAMIGPAYVYCMRSLKGGADEMMTIIWIAAIIIFGIAEAATAGLVSIWFVVGAVASRRRRSWARRCGCNSRSSWSYPFWRSSQQGPLRARCWIRRSCPRMPTVCCTTRPR